MYKQIYIDEGFFDVKLSKENEMMIELYEKILDPTNQSIDWESYMMFCYLEDYPNWKDNQEIILHIRKTLSNYKDKRYEQNNKTKELKSDENSDRIRKVNY